MTCQELAAGLADFLDGSMEPRLLDAGLEHLATCEQCRVVVDQTRQVIDLGGTHGSLTLDPLAKAAIRSRLGDRPS